MEKFSVRNTTHPSGSHRSTVAIYIIITLAVLGLANFYPPVKHYLFSFGEQFRSHGNLGPIILVLIIGFIVIPFALPYTIFELCLTIIVGEYFKTVFFALIAKFLGCSICYLFSKYIIRAKVKATLAKEKYFILIEKLLEKKTLHFSLLFRILMIPFFIKNYGLAIPRSVDYKTYITAVILTAVPQSMLEINFYRMAGNLESTVSQRNSFKTLFTALMLILTVLILVYIFFYSRKFLKQAEIEEESENTRINFELEEYDMEAQEKIKLDSDENQADTNDSQIDLDEKIGASEDSHPFN